MLYIKNTRNRILFKSIIYLILSLISFSAIAICNSGIPNSRYQNNNDGTILDIHTGLLWQRCALGQTSDDCSGSSATTLTWAAALQAVTTENSNADITQYSDWRLPNINELYTLVEIACYSPAINVTFFPNTKGSFYWSSSRAVDENKTWGIYFQGGGVNTVKRDANYGHYVRLVRGGL